jgi:hypothetical protein
MHYHGCFRNWLLCLICLTNLLVLSRLSSLHLHFPSRGLPPPSLFSIFLNPKVILFI